MDSAAMRRGRARGFWALILCCAMAAVAGAQERYRAWGTFRPGISEIDLDEMTEILTLTAEQQDIVTGLLAGYEQAFTAGAEATRVKMSDVNDQVRNAASNDVYMQVQAQKVIIEDEWTAQASQLEADFFESVRALLSPDQTDRWEEYERTRRRRMSLRLGARFPGDNIDLIALVSGLELPAARYAELEPLLDSYAIELDQSLRGRNEAFEEAITAMRGSAGTGSPLTNQRELLARADQYRVQIQQLNARTLEQIAGMLTPEEEEAFRRAYLEEAYPAIYRESAVERYLETIRRLPDLTDDQRQQLDAIEREFNREMGALNARAVELERQREVEMREMIADAAGGNEPNFVSGGGRSETSKAIAQIRMKRGAYESETLDRLVAVLTPQQQEVAPRGAAWERDARDDGDDDGDDDENPDD